MMRSILKVTIIACLFYGCCPPCEKEHLECKKISLTDGKYVEATLISQTNSRSEIGFFSINEDDDMSLIAYTKQKFKEASIDIDLKIYQKYYITIKVCNDISWVDEITSTKPEVIASPPESKIKYHAFFHHNHSGKHRFGHIPKNLNERKESQTQTHEVVMYDLEIFDDNEVEIQGKYGSQLVYEMQNYLIYQYTSAGGTEDFIEMNYMMHPEDDNRIIDINACHIHGAHIIDCVEWYPN